jgi:hypothetical protein
MFESDPEILPGWKMSADEVSNNVYKVVLTDLYGRKAEITNDDFDYAVRLCQEKAFEIEKQVSKSWGRFLYEIFRLKLSGRSISEEVYHEMHFGSWLIKLAEKRIVYDGKDGLLMLQLNTGDAWTTIKTIKDIKALSIYQVEELIQELKT